MSIGSLLVGFFQGGVPGQSGQRYGYFRTPDGLSDYSLADYDGFGFSKQIKRYITLNSE